VQRSHLALEPAPSDEVLSRRIMKAIMFSGFEEIVPVRWLPMCGFPDAGFAAPGHCSDCSTVSLYPKEGRQEPQAMKPFH
jgi:hypothetical protein